MISLVIVLATFVAAANPGQGEEPSPDMQDYIKAYIGVEFVDTSCPDFRANTYHLDKFLAAHGLTKDDVRGRFKHYATRLVAQLDPVVRADRAKVCEYFEDLYGEYGEFPNLVERR